jgi:hypothetical protein
MEKWIKTYDPFDRKRIEDFKALCQETPQADNLSKLIQEQKEKNPYFPFNPPFENIKKEEENDQYLKANGFKIDSNLASYYTEIELYGIGYVLDGIEIGMSGLFERLNGWCLAINQYSDRPIFLKNRLTEWLLKLNEYQPPRGVIVQILLLQGLIVWFKESSLKEGDMGYKEAESIYFWIHDKFIDVCLFYFAVVIRNANTEPLDNYLGSIDVCKQIMECYKQSQQTRIEQNKQPQPELTNQHFTRSFTSDGQKKLFEGLKSAGLLPKDTNKNHFNFVFGGTDIPDEEKPFKKLDWIKTNSRTHEVMPNKKSLLDLLNLLEVKETEIKNKPLINSVFNIPKGGKFEGNNYSNITDAKGNLITPIISDYHNELAEIVRKSKENKK